MEGLNTENVISIFKENMDTIEKFHVNKLGLFGSFARDEQASGSDIDVLVEFENGFETFDNYMDLKFYIEDLFSLEVDLVILGSIKPALKSSILRSTKYAKGA